MTSFKWKHKIGENVCKETAKKFKETLVDEDDNENGSAANFEPTEDVLFVRPKKMKMIALEDKETKAMRLLQEGCLLAENDRLWEAIKKWDEAIQLTPNDEKLYEMKAQALSELHEVLLAIKVAERAVDLKPNWWVAHQTLGRAQLGIGEVNLAIKCFSKACHLNPSEEELWEDDLRWAISLREQSLKVKSKSEASSASSSVVKPKLVIKELDKGTNSLDDDDEEGEPLRISSNTGTNLTQCEPLANEDVKRLSINSWIRMRPVINKTDCLK